MLRPFQIHVFVFKSCRMETNSCNPMIKDLGSAARLPLFKPSPHYSLANDLGHNSQSPNFLTGKMGLIIVPRLKICVEI